MPWSSSTGWNNEGWSVVSGGSSSYSGPGDLVSGAGYWGGLRGYSAAYAAPGTNPAVDLVDQAGANPATFNILSNGSLDVASISAWQSLHSVTTIKITTLYDQSGNASNLTQGTLVTMPVLTLTGLSSFPAINFSGAQYLLGNITITTSQPITITTVANCTNGASGQQSLMQSSSIELGFGSGGTANTIFMYSGAQPSYTASDGHWHSAQAVWNGGSSNLELDGTPNSNSAGGGVPTTLVYYGSAGGSQFLTGGSTSVGVWSSALTNTQCGQIYSNDLAYYGTLP